MGIYLFEVYQSVPVSRQAENKCDMFRRVKKEICKCRVKIEKWVFMVFQVVEWSRLLKVLGDRLVNVYFLMQAIIAHDWGDESNLNLLRTVGDRLTNTYMKDFCVRTTNA